jgi:hypothetical protein
MSTGRERAVARELAAVAWNEPLSLAPAGPGDPKFFRQIDREITWGLTLNK